MKPSLSDRLVGLISPKRMAERVAYRKRAEILAEMEGGARGYKAAENGRLSRDFRGATESEDAILRREKRALRARARQLVMDEPLASRIVQIHGDYIVGEGIRPRANTGDTALNKAANDYFARFADKPITADGTLNFYGLQYQAVTEMVTTGDYLMRKRLRRPQDRVPSNLQIEPLESEMLDQGRIETSSSGYINNGIEYDRIGRRRGYWIFNEHPGSAGLSLGRLTLSTQSRFVPADEIAHLYEPKRVQSIGVTWLAPVMTDIKDIAGYFHAEDIRKRVEACVVGVVIPGTDQTDPIVGVDATLDENGHSIADAAGLRDAYGNPLETMEPGMWAYAHGGQDIKFNNPAMTTGQESYIRTRLRKIAVGGRIPYELLASDYGDTNFASGKLSVLHFLRHTRHQQRHRAQLEINNPPV